MAEVFLVPLFLCCLHLAKKTLWLHQKKKKKKKKEKEKAFALPGTEISIWEQGSFLRLEADEKGMKSGFFTSQLCLDNQTLREELSPTPF